MGIGLIFMQVTVLFGRLFIVVIGEPIVSLGCRLISEGIKETCSRFCMRFEASMVA